MRNSTDNRSSERAPRIPVNLTVRVVGSRADGKAMLVNVARGGVFVGTDSPAKVGSLVHLQFRMLKARVCQAVGTVVWQRANANDQTAGFGVRFVDTNQNMDSFVRNVSSLPAKLRTIYLADVLEPRIELGVTTQEIPTLDVADEVA